jgi:hypothetical protein
MISSGFIYAGAEIMPDLPTFQTTFDAAYERWRSRNP